MKFIYPLIATIMLLGCNQSNSNDNQQAASPAVAAAAQPQAPTSGKKDWAYYQKWLPTAPREDFNDPDQWSDLRLEFQWYADESTHPGTPDIYSMKTDGSDIRLAVEAELLSADKKTYILTRLRSPNAKYLAIHLREYERKGVVRIINLIDRTFEDIEVYLIPGRFAWDVDSSGFYYYGGDGLTRYDLAKKTAKLLPMTINAFGFFPLYDGNYLAAFQDRYEFYSNNGEMLLRVQLDRNYSNSARVGISPDQKYLYVSDAEACLFDLTTTTGIPLICGKEFASDNMDLTNNAFIDQWKGIVSYPFAGNESVQLVEDMLYSANKLRVINRGLYSHSKPRYPYQK